MIRCLPLHSVFWEGPGLQLWHTVRVAGAAVMVTSRCFCVADPACNNATQASNLRSRRACAVACGVAPCCGSLQSVSDCYRAGCARRHLTHTQRSRLHLRLLHTVKLFFTPHVACPVPDFTAVFPCPVLRVHCLTRLVVLYETVADTSATSHHTTSHALHT